MQEEQKRSVIAEIPRQTDGNQHSGPVRQVTDTQA